MKHLRAIACLAALGLAAGACTPTESSDTGAASVPPAAVQSASGDTSPAGAAPEQPAQAQTQVADAQPQLDGAASDGAPAWHSTALTDALTGNEFTLADFAGKTVYVETFATWCPSCKQQLGNVSAARSKLGDDVVVVALCIEPNISADQLKEYAAGAGFDWIFAAVPQAMLKDMADILGQTVTNPPATPHFMIRPDGSMTELETGIEGPEDIVQAIHALQG